MMVSFAKNVTDLTSNVGKNHIVILSALDSGKTRVINASR
jgi:proteasome assembly chaperone 2